MTGSRRTSKKDDIIRPPPTRPGLKKKAPPAPPSNGGLPQPSSPLPSTSRGGEPATTSSRRCPTTTLQCPAPTASPSSATSTSPPPTSSAACSQPGVPPPSSNHPLSTLDNVLASLFKNSHDGGMDSSSVTAMLKTAGLAVQQLWRLATEGDRASFVTLARGLGKMVDIFQHSRDFQASLSISNMAIKVIETKLGTLAPDEAVLMADVLLSRGRTLVTMGCISAAEAQDNTYFEEAVKAGKQAVAMICTAWGALHPSRVYYMGFIYEVMVHYMGDFPRAKDVLDHCISVYDTLNHSEGGSDTTIAWGLASLLHERARIRAMMEDFSSAVNDLYSAMAKLRPVHGSEMAQVELLKKAAVGCECQGDVKGAIVALEEAIATLEKMSSPNNVELVEVLKNLNQLRCLLPKPRPTKRGNRSSSSYSSSSSSCSTLAARALKPEKEVKVAPTSCRDDGISSNTVHGGATITPHIDSTTTTATVKEAYMANKKAGKKGRQRMKKQQATNATLTNVLKKVEHGPVTAPTLTRRDSSSTVSSLTDDEFWSTSSSSPTPVKSWSGLFNKKPVATTTTTTKAVMVPTSHSGGHGSTAWPELGATTTLKPSKQPKTASSSSYADALKRRSRAAAF